ncbi:DNA-binding protein [Corynebacterium diphtheriae]|nr:transposase-like protein [Corynebacterium diphtheriae HC03]AEX81777.1 transposase-like protein [Corynebacterium diphtheriae HC04]OLN12426.1 DNA-binding protein [Corynebacterium diphtheriae]OLN12461.1 DNA-binding protein [Corynebacterium diphtheriae]ONF67690.1 DNA-binding protein [Corynebacterium diphtheriae]
MFICQTLNTHREGGFITSRGYRQSKARGLSVRSLRDAALVEHIRDVHAENYGVYGVRKIWEAEFLEASPQSRNNRNQGKCLGTKLGALQTSRSNHLISLTG